MITARGSRRRLTLALVAVFVVIVVFGVRLVDIQVVRAETLSTIAGSNYTSATIWGTRGSIVDANGTVLATSVDRFNITASPKLVDLAGFQRVEKVDGENKRVDVSFSDAVNEIAQLTGADIQQLTTALTSDPDSDFVYLVKSVKLDVFRAVTALRIPWVYSEPQPARSYPNGAIAGNLVGLMGTDGALSGTELKWNECLASTNGTTEYAYSADGVRMPGSEVVETPAVDGGTVHLTIDADLQWFAQQALAEQGTAIGARWGTAMVVEVKTGRIVAAADWPSIDPNDLNSASADDSGSRIFTAPYEPGSLIKTATVAGMLDAGVITADTQLTVPSAYYIGKDVIHDSWAHDAVNYTVAGILVNSSNIGIGMLTERQPLADRIDYLKAFGFGSPTGADFLGEEAGTVHGVDSTDPVTAVTQQFGQGMTATSAQVMSMYQTIGNHGVRIPLTLVDGCEHPDGSYTAAPTPEGERVVSQYAADTTVNILENVVTNYHLGPTLSVPGYRIAAKSGTAEVAAGGRYTSDRIVSVAGLLPADDPQYAIDVTFAFPTTIKSSRAAAPTFHALAEQVIKTFRVPPSTEPAPSIPLTW
ncbi:peptidoglycan D,D-transpeptidase FtsI family protein [Protaetiibacter intestinalis]|uniref:Penicillin-binding protein 2 n=1 Tax=Protaetiibacter intestinalis TaxID=2419774 RepID=A0A387BL26_9MICO|nr:penicillin-binding protein 2 [Protaetiibacter intestinalis]AYF99210.1 penicillin-binding protein 2 [Protaetiibacter intestinalis]